MPKTPLEWIGVVTAFVTLSVLCGVMALAAYNIGL